jgi:hypothetical protein
MGQPRGILTPEEQARIIELQDLLIERFEKEVLSRLWPYRALCVGACIAKVSRRPVARFCPIGSTPRRAPGQWFGAQCVLEDEEFGDPKEIAGEERLAMGERHLASQTRLTNRLPPEHAVSVALDWRAFSRLTWLCTATAVLRRRQRHPRTAGSVSTGGAGLGECGHSASPKRP